MGVNPIVITEPSTAMGPHEAAESIPKEDGLVRCGGSRGWQRFRGQKLERGATTKPPSLWVSRFGLGFRLVSISLGAVRSKVLDKVPTKVLSMGSTSKMRDGEDWVGVGSKSGTDEIMWGGFVVDANVVTVTVSSKVCLATEVSDTVRTISSLAATRWRFRC
ncbi:hypothetical protein V6N13_038867 [Hibiscus sabdariffa]